MIKYKVNQEFKEFESLTKNIKEFFENSGETIHKARNELKILPYHDREVVVKSFKVPNPINRFVYAYLRDSKAKKSFLNAIKLLSLGVATPTPISYIEFYSGGVLKNSFYITLLTRSDFVIREPLYDKDFKDREEIIKQFVFFTYSMHQKRVFHRDFSAGNTLVAKDKNGYIFSIVDINRLEFREFDLDLAMQNFNKLWLDEDSLVFIAKEYAKISGYDEAKCIKRILYHDKKLKDFVTRRRKIKAFFKAKKG